MSLTQPLYKIIKKMFPNLYKLNVLANAINNVVIDENGSLYIEYKNHIVTNVNGGIITTSKDIHVVNSECTLHINPVDFNIDSITNNVETVVLEKKERLLEDIKLEKEKEHIHSSTC